MPSDYKTIPIFLNGTGEITGYTCPTNRKAIIKNMTFTNVSGVSAYVNAKWYEVNSAGINGGSPTGVFQLMKSGTVNPYNGLSIFNDFLVIKEGDFITVQSQNPSSLYGFISLMEQEISIL